MRYSLRTLLIVLALVASVAIFTAGVHFGMIALCDYTWEAASKSFGHLTIHPGWFK